MTEEGQASFLDHLRDTLLYRTRCRALFYWGSHWTQAKLWFRGGEDWDDARRRAIFDGNGKALKGLMSFPGLLLGNKFVHWQKLWKKED